MLNILIVEDEFLLAMDIERVVETAGYRVVGTAADREEALALAPQACLAFVDLHLRDGLTGVDVAHELATRHQVPVVYVTANPSQISSYAPTAVGIVSKPFADFDILAAIRHVEGQMTPAPLPRQFKAWR